MTKLLSLVLLLWLAGCGSSHGDDDPHAGHHMASSEGTPPAPSAQRRAPALHGQSLEHLDPDLSLVDQHGARLSFAALAGRPVLLTFFYSGCTTMCPLIVTDVKRIEAALTAAERERLTVVLVTIDPTRDTIEQLPAIATARAIPTRWRLVTGDEGSVRALASTLGMTYRALPDGSFAHAALYTVLDAEGRVAHQLEGTGQPIEELVALLQRFLGSTP